MKILLNFIIISKIIGEMRTLIIIQNMILMIGAIMENLNTKVQKKY